MGQFRPALLLCLATRLTAATLSPLAAETLPPCHGAMKPRQVAELLFSRAVDRHVGVSETAWARFVARELTPRFPDGLTITDAVGQWRVVGGTLVREPAKRVEIVLPGNADDEARLADAVQSYKREFRQHSVGVVVHAACVSF